MTPTAAPGPTPPADGLLRTPPWWSLLLSGGRIQPLAHQTCLQLLAASRTGTLVHLQQPRAVLDVLTSYRSGASTILLAPEVGSPVALAPSPLVQLRVDHLHTDRRTGWSLMIVGALGPAGPAAPTPASFRLDVRTLTGRLIAMPTTSRLPERQRRRRALEPARCRLGSRSAQRAGTRDPQP